MNKLKMGCPFCGEKDHLDIASVFVSCRACGAVGPYVVGLKDCIELWNGRQQLSELEIHVERTAYSSTSKVSKLRVDSATPFVLMVPCTSQKTVIPPIEACLTSFKVGTQEDLQQRWITMLKEQPAKVSARNMYVGRSVRILASLSLSYDFPMCILSTGVGLTDASSPIPAYDLTMAKNAPASLSGKVIGKFNPQMWWEAIKAGSPYCMPFQQMFDMHEKGLVVLAVSEDFVDLLWDELQKLAPEQVVRLRIITMTGSLGVPDNVKRCVLPYEPSRCHGMLQSGSMLDFAYRAAQHYITERLIPEDVTLEDIEACKFWVNSKLQEPREPRESRTSASQASRETGTRGARQAMTDDSIASIIREHSLHTFAVTKGIRLLRDMGHSCSQVRYDHIIAMIKKEALVTTAEAEAETKEAEDVTE